MPSPDLTEADRVEIEKAGRVMLSPELWAALCSLQCPDGDKPEQLPEDEGTYQNVMKSLERRANVTQRMIEEFDPRSPAGCLADEAIGETLVGGIADDAIGDALADRRHVFLSELARLKLAIDQAVAELRHARAEGGRPWRIPKRYAELLDIYCQAGGRPPTDYVNNPCIAFLCCAHAKLWHLHIGHEAMRARIKVRDKMLDEIQARLEAEDAE